MARRHGLPDVNDELPTDWNPKDFDGTSVSVFKVPEGDDRTKARFERASKGTSPMYPMKETKRGRFLVIGDQPNRGSNSSGIDDSLVLPASMLRRPDQEIMESLFGQLGFDVVTKDNATSTKIVEAFREQAAFDHSDNDCFACVIFAKGDSTGDIIGGDGVPVKLTSLLNMLDGVNCPTLNGKPKLFFIQIDQGKEGMPARALSQEQSADFFIAYATVPGTGESAKPTKPGVDNVRSVGVAVPRPSSVISVSIVQGNICEQQADMLVNSAPEVLTTPKGKVLQALLNAGGKGLADEFASNHPGKLESGKAFYTSGHRLPCQKVCYMGLPKYRPGVEQVLGTLGTSCLTEANKAGYKSVAFPALGTGGLGYPTDVVARTTLGAVSKFNRDVPSTTLRDVRIVIDHKNTDILTNFQQVHSQMESVNGSVGSSSAFIRTVAFVFSRLAHQYDILALMTRVNRLLSTAQGTTHVSKQMPTFTSTLTRELFFFPGLRCVPAYNPYPD